MKLEHFRTEEFICPEMYTARGENSIHYIDTGLLAAAVYIREHFPVVVINNWVWGGACKNSGLRTSYGRKWSAHRYGKAFDFKTNRTPTELMNFILENESLFYSLGIRRIENPNVTPTWLHVDTLLTETCTENEIYVFNP